MTDTAAASRAPKTAKPGVSRADTSRREAERGSSRAPKTAQHGVHPSSIAELAGPIADEVGCALYDVQWRGGTLVVLASAAAGGAVGVEELGRLSRRLSAELDAADMIDGRYVLEVSSPGLERKLLRPEHFAGAVGERVVIRTNQSPRRRIVGEITQADASGVCVHVEELSSGAEGAQSVSAEGAQSAGAEGAQSASAEGAQQTQPGSIGESMTVAYSDISKARTTFEWGARRPSKAGPGPNTRNTSGRTPRERQRR